MSPVIFAVHLKASDNSTYSLIIIHWVIYEDVFNPEAFHLTIFHICPGLNANEIQTAHEKHHKVSSLVKSHQNTLNSVKYEAI